MGKRPTAHVRRRHERRSGYGVVRPATGPTSWAVLPTVNTNAFSVALAAVAHDEGIGPTGRAMLVLAGPGERVSKKLVAPEGVHVAFRPSSSPELPPAERVWPLVDEPTANRAFAECASAIARNPYDPG